MPGNRWVLAKYILFQVPGWIAAIYLAWWAYTDWGLSLFWAVSGVCLFVVKDAVLYPFVKTAYSIAPGKGAAPEPGTCVVAAEDIDPKGYVRISAELWRAELRSGSAAIPAGATAQIHSVDGLTLIVEWPESEGSSED